MRGRLILPLAVMAMVAAPPIASADFAHTIMPGESLWSVAAADGLSVGQLAAANGLSSGAQLTYGSTLFIPPQGGGPVQAAAPARSGSPASVGDGDADSDDGFGGQATPVTQPSGGSYVVQPGDTLSAIAARDGTTVAQLAAANGLNPNAPLLSGTALSLSGAGSGSAGSSAATSQPVGAVAQGSAGAPPYPTNERVSSSQVGQIAAANGVSPSLADAVAYQESGFNNALVSSADARGVMQILPGTWDWIQRTLTAGTPLAPASAASNVRGGVLLLHSLLNATGGDPGQAAAGYYQGLPSVQQNGVYPSTQQYVNDVLSLQRQFGGG
jgi:LysM repeat protein